MPPPALDPSPAEQTFPAERTVANTRVFAASLEQVYAAFVSAELGRGPASPS